MAETTMEAVPIPTEEPKREKKKRKFSFPSAFTILFIVTIIAVICTWFVPAGQYSKLLYDAESGKLEMTTPTGEVSQLDVTQQTLDDLGVKIDIDQFTSGAITKAVSIPGTYEGLDPHPVSLADIPYSMVWGVIDGIDVMVFILCLGGLIGVVKVTGAFESGLSALTKKTKGREFLLVFGVSVFMIFGGTMCGLEEEAVAFYPILAPIFIALGYDSIVVVGAIFMAGSIGTMIGYAVSKNRRSRWANYVNSVAFLPYLMPSIAVGVAFFILFSTEKLNLFNTYTLLIIVGTVKYIPFASRSSLNSMLQLSGEIEEAAIIQNIPWIKRMTRIIIPIQKSSIISGFLLPFMTCLRELSLFMLLCVQGFILSTTLDYFDEMGLYAFSSGINLILIVTILVCNTLVNKITGASLDKGIGG